MPWRGSELGSFGSIFLCGVIGAAGVKSLIPQGRIVGMEHKNDPQISRRAYFLPIDSRTGYYDGAMCAAGSVVTWWPVVLRKFATKPIGQF